MDKKNILTYEGLKKLEDELENLKVVRRKEVSQKIKEAREQGDLSENAEYDAAKDEQRDIEARIEELEKIASEMRTKIQDFNESMEDSWVQIKGDIDSSRNKINDAFARLNRSLV